MRKLPHVPEDDLSKLHEGVDPTKVIITNPMMIREDGGSFQINMKSKAMIITLIILIILVGWVLVIWIFGATSANYKEMNIELPWFVYIPIPMMVTSTGILIGSIIKTLIS